MGEARRKREARHRTIAARRAEMLRLERLRRDTGGEALELPKGGTIPLTLTIRLGVPVEDMRVLMEAEIGGDYRIRERFTRRVLSYVRSGMEGKLVGMIDDQLTGAMCAYQWAPVLQNEEGEREGVPRGDDGGDERPSTAGSDVMDGRG